MYAFVGGVDAVTRYDRNTALDPLPDEVTKPMEYALQLLTGPFATVRHLKVKVCEVHGRVQRYAMSRPATVVA